MKECVDCNNHQQQQVISVNTNDKGQSNINNFIPIQRSIQVNTNNNNNNNQNVNQQQRFYNVNANDLINNYTKFYNNNNRISSCMLFIL